MKMHPFGNHLLSACLLAGVVLGSLAQARPNTGGRPVIIIPPVNCQGQTCHWEWVWEYDKNGVATPHYKLVCTPNCLPA